MSLTSRLLRYEHDGVELQGELIADDAANTALPGILLVHGGSGLDDHARAQARRYAALGYVVLACDMYGKGVPGHRERVLATITALREDPDLLAARGAAGLSALISCPEVDGPVSAVGFCFGGLAVLTLARSGADVAATISMHGSLDRAGGNTRFPDVAGSRRREVAAAWTQPSASARSARAAANDRLSVGSWYSTPGVAPGTA